MATEKILKDDGITQVVEKEGERNGVKYPYQYTRPITLGGAIKWYSGFKEGSSEAKARLTAIDTGESLKANAAAATRLIEPVITFKGKRIHLVNDLTPAQSCAVVNAHFTEVANLGGEAEPRYAKAREVLLATGKAVEKNGMLVPAAK